MILAATIAGYVAGLITGLATAGFLITARGN